MTTNQPSILDMMKSFVESAKARSEGPWNYPEAVYIMPSWMFKVAEELGLEIVSTEWGITIKEKEHEPDAN